MATDAYAFYRRYRAFLSPQCGQLLVDVVPLALLADVEHIDGFLTCRAPHDVTHGSSSTGPFDLEAGGVADLSSASMMTEA